MGFDIYSLLLTVPVLLLALTLHEFAHGWVALQYGDPTAKLAGRVTLNPLKHLDPLGTLCLFLVHFGWAKPVPVNPGNFSHPRAGLWVSLAGIVANGLQAVLYALAWHLLPHLFPGIFTTYRFLVPLLIFGIGINLSLALFNLLPLFPLDGSHILPHLLPRRQAYKFSLLSQRYGAAVLLGLVLIGYVSTVSPLNILIGVPRTWLTYLLLRGI